MAQGIVKQIHSTLIKNNSTVAVAESCTGGLLCAYLTQIPGSSKFFFLGIVAYHNQAKEDILHIPPGIIRKYGAVSRKAASLMAEAVRRLAKAGFGMGITGIAGPTGGSARKPPGTAFIAISSAKKTICKRFKFSGTRGEIRKKAALEALQLLKSFFRDSPL